MADDSDQEAAPRTKLTIATYNVQNLFDVFDDPYTKDEGTRVKPLDQIKQIAGVLRKLDADVIAFQELENEGVLREMVRQFLGDRLGRSSQDG